MLMEMVMVVKSPAPIPARTVETGGLSWTLMEQGWKQHMMWSETHQSSAIYFLDAFEKMPSSHNCLNFLTLKKNPKGETMCIKLPGTQ